MSTSLATTEHLLAGLSFPAAAVHLSCLTGPGGKLPNAVETP